MKRTIENIIKCSMCSDELKFLSYEDTKIQAGKCLRCYLHYDCGYPYKVNYVGDKKKFEMLKKY